MISDAQWDSYERDGYLRLGRVLDRDDVTRLQDRINRIMLGEAHIDYSALVMQRDSDTGRYADAGEQSKGFKGATLEYRKIQELEQDPLFLEYLQQPIFREICDRVLGIGTSVACFRAMFMNKPAKKGTFLPWHQDRWTSLDRDPLITLWTALDPATITNGCVQVIPGSHRHGLINPAHPSGFLTPTQAEEYCPQERRVFLELEPGEAVLLHNWLLHASDRNNTDVSRRAFSVCYMDAATHDIDTGRRYPIVFGPGALEFAQTQDA